MDSIQPLGLPLHSAIFELTPEEFKEVAALFRQRVIRGTAAPTDSTWRLLYGEVASRVLTGELEAVGTRHGQIEAEAIPPRFFVEARPNIEAGSIEHAGVTYHGVRVREPASSAEKTAAHAWMVQNATPASKRDITIADCMKATGATWRDTLAAWNALPVAIKGTRGSKKR